VLCLAILAHKIYVLKACRDCHAPQADSKVQKAKEQGRAGHSLSRQLHIYHIYVHFCGTRVGNWPASGFRPVVISPVLALGLP